MKLVPLTQGAFAIIDDEDGPLIAPYTWHAAKSGRLLYACTRIDESIVSMAALLMKPAPGMVVDHISGQSLDNRRANLRICTVRQNSWNRAKGRSRAKKRSNTGSQYKGVSRFEYAGKKGTRISWRAFIRTETCPRVHLGMFKTEEDAARAYDEAARHHFGPFARLNFPDDQSTVPPDGFFKPQESSECETNRSATDTRGCAL